MLKWILGIVLVGLLLLGGGGWFVLTSEATAGFRDRIKSRFEKREPPLAVQLHATQRGALTRRVGAPGTLEPRTKVEISAQVSARITGLPKREGDRVDPADVVVRMDARDLQARRDAAVARLSAEEARLEGARARFAMLESEFARRKQLFESGDISQGDIERTESEFLSITSELKIIKATIDAQRAAVMESERDLENAVIVSPIKGVVTRLEAEVGELAVVGTLNNPGSVILELADLEDMLVKARIDESNIASVEAGQSATVYVNAYGDDPFEGVVERVGLTRKRWEDGSYYYEAEIALPYDPARPLRAGMTAAVELEVEMLDAVLKLPSQAVLDRRVDELPVEVVSGNALVNSRKTFARVVYRVVDGRTVVTPVAIGPSDLTHTVILGGLSEGDEVVVGPYRVLLAIGHDRAAEVERATETAEQSGGVVAEEQGGGGDGAGG